MHLGWEFGHQTGSHFIYKRPGHQTVVVPNHRGMVRPGTLGSIIRQMGLNRAEFDRIANEVL